MADLLYVCPSIVHGLEREVLLSVLLLGGRLLAARRAVEELHVTRRDLQGGARTALAVDPRAGAYLPLDVYPRALLQVLVGCLGQPPPARHAEPLGLLTRLAVRVPPAAVHRHREVGDGRAFRGVAHFGVAPQVADQGYSLEHGAPPMCGDAPSAPWRPQKHKAHRQMDGLHRGCGRQPAHLWRG